MMLLVVISLIAVPIHFVQQTRPSSVWVFDGFGSVTNTDNVAEGWSDCFEFVPVHDRLGFFGYWRNDGKDKPGEWLSVT